MTTTEMEGITRPAITRISRRGGVKSVSDDCFPVVRNLIQAQLDEVIRTALLVNSEHQTRTLMSDDIYEALRLNGHNVAQSTELGTNTGTK
jgi:histone H4